MTVVRRSMDQAAIEDAGPLTSTLSGWRSAAHSPGLVCPYRQGGLCPLTRETYLATVFSEGDYFASKSAPHGLRRKPFPRTRVNKLRCGVTSFLVQRCV